MCFFVLVKSYHKKKKKVQNCPNDLVYITNKFIKLSVIIFKIKSQQLPAMVLAWENLYEVFVLLFIFDVVYLHQLWVLPRLVLIGFSFWSTASATVLSGHLFTQMRFLPYSASSYFGTTCFYQGLPGSPQLFLEICRASYWSSTRPICFFDSQ